MNPSNYYLLGPILAQGSTDISKFIITYNDRKIPFFLTVVKSTDPKQPLELILDPRVISPVSNEANIGSVVVLSASSGQASVRLSFTFEDKVYFITGAESAENSNNKKNVFATPTKTSASVIQITTEYNNWGILLAGVHYSFVSSSNENILWKAYEPDMSSLENGVPTLILFEADGVTPKIQTITNKIRIVTTTWYDKKQNCGSIKDLQDVIEVEINWATEKGTLPEAFTKSTDCATGRRYKYCGPKQSCGSSCNGPCTSASGPGDVCLFGDDKYSCSVPPDKSNKLIWWIIIGVAVFIIIVIVIYWISRSSKKTPLNVHIYKHRTQQIRPIHVYQ